MGHGRPLIKGDRFIFLVSSVFPARDILPACLSFSLLHLYTVYFRSVDSVVLIA